MKAAAWIVGSLVLALGWAAWALGPQAPAPVAAVTLEVARRGDDIATTPSGVVPETLAPGSESGEDVDSSGVAAIPTETPIASLAFGVDEATGDVIGRAVDDQGRPVRDAEFVAAWDGDLRRVPVDPGGRFRAVVPAGRGVRCSIHAGPRRGPEPARTVLLQPGEIRDLGELALVPVRAIAGRVTDDDGAPVAAADVRVVDGPAGTTDPSGAFVLTDVPAASCRIAVAASGFRARTLEVPAGEPTLTIVLSPAAALTGRVVAADTGAPVPGFRVSTRALRAARFDDPATPQIAFVVAPRAEPAAGTSFQDPEGRFSIGPAMEPGGHRIEVRADGFAPLVAEVRVDAVGSLPEPVFRMRRARRVAGRVVAADDGRPLPGATVLFCVAVDRDASAHPGERFARGLGPSLPLGDTIRVGVADASGSFVFDDLPDVVGSVRARADGYALGASGPLRPGIGGDGPRGDGMDRDAVVVRLSRAADLVGEVRGTATDVKVVVWSGTAGYAVVRPEPAEDGGRFRVAGRPPGRAVVAATTGEPAALMQRIHRHVAHTGVAPDWCALVDLVSGRPARVQVDPAPGADGAVVGSVAVEGVPAEGHHVRLVPRGVVGVPRHARIPASGRFRFDDLVPGTYELEVAAAVEGPVLERQSVLVSDATASLAIALRR